MSPGTWQLAAGATLIGVWIWMVARPSVARWSSRRRVAEFERAGTDWFDLAPDGAEHSDGTDSTDGNHGGRIEEKRIRNPIRTWRSQPLGARRLQTMLGFALATFFSLLMAVALGGEFTRMFMVMVVLFGVYLSVAALIGADQLRREGRRSGAEPAAPASAVGRERRLGTRHGDVRLDFIDADDLGLARRLRGKESPLAQARAVRFEPLNLDADRPVQQPTRTPAPDPVPEPAREPAREDAAEGQASSRPGFSAAPEAGRKQASARARRTKRSKARPIYIESVLDEDEPQAGSEGK